MIMDLILGLMLLNLIGWLSRCVYLVISIGAIKDG